MVTSLLPVVAGVLARSLWMIPLFGVLFSMAYILKRQAIWWPLLAEGMSVRLIAMILSTLCVQTAIVVMLYGIGYLIDFLVGDGAGLHPPGVSDVALALVLVAAMAVEAMVAAPKQEGVP